MSKLFSLLPHIVKRIHFDGTLYITNRFIANIPFHFLRLSFYKYCMGFEIANSSHVFMGAWFDNKRHFKMGKNSIINQKCRLDNRGYIIIGESVSISAEVCILTGDHDPQSPDFLGRVRPVTIEDYVFIGTRAMILPGVTLGKGCYVAAGAVVTKNISPFTIVAGVPAKSIGNRPSNLKYSASYPRLFF